MLCKVAPSAQVFNLSGFTDSCPIFSGTINIRQRKTNPKLKNCIQSFKDSETYVGITIGQKARRTAGCGRTAEREGMYILLLLLTNVSVSFLQILRVLLVKRTTYCTAG